jgi:hypothetical protein
MKFLILCYLKMTRNDLEDVLLSGPVWWCIRLSAQTLQLLQLFSTAKRRRK